MLARLRPLVGLPLVLLACTSTDKDGLTLPGDSGAGDSGADSGSADSGSADSGPDTGADSGTTAPRAHSVLLVTFDTLPLDLYRGMTRLHAWMDRTGGVEATRHWSTGPVTPPAIVTLLTGQSPLDYGTWLYGNDRRGSPIPSDAAVTLADRFGAAGMGTYLSTSGGMVGETTGTDQGYATYEIYIEDPEAQIAAALTRLPTLAAKGPFFAHIHFMVTHDPYNDLDSSCAEDAARATCPVDGLDWNTLDALDTLESAVGTLSADDLAACADDARRRQSCEAVRLDVLVEGLLTGLTDDGVIGDDVAVAIVTDHGESYGDRGFGHNLGLWGEQDHVGAWVHVPGARTGLLDRATSHVDLATTLLQATGLDATGLPGRSLLDPDASELPFAVWSKGDSFTVSVIDESGTLRYEADTEGGARMFDLEADPDERFDLIYNGAAPPPALREVADGLIAEIEAADRYR